MVVDDGLVRDIHAKVVEMAEAVAKMEGAQQGQATVCKMMSKRVERLEEQVGRRNMIAGILGAVAAGITLAIGYIIKMLGGGDG